MSGNDGPETSTSALNPSASAFVFKPRGRPATPPVRLEKVVDEFGALGLVSEDEEDDENAVDAADESAFASSGGERPIEPYAALAGEEPSPSDFDDSLTFLGDMFPNMDWACLEEALMNTGGDVELAMELLMDDEIPDIPAPDVDDAEAFPSLGGGGGGTSTSAPRAPEPLPKKIFLSGGMSNVNKASASVNWNTRATKTETASVSASGKIERGVRDGTKTKIEWVETGAAVSQLYAANRDEARDYARVRNVCYEQATNAYLSGNKALAKELSRQGREAAAKMSQAHAQAAHNIYHSRGGGSDGVIDLHGLHVAEALSLLRRELSRLRGSGCSHAQILVGTGHHTVGSRTPSRLPVAVETFLQEHHWRFSERQAGLLEVSLD